MSEKKEEHASAHHEKKEKHASHLPGEGDVIFKGAPHCCSCSDWCTGRKWLITTEFIEFETGICCKSIENLQLMRVKDIQYVSGSCCCGYCGTIRILSSDETTPELRITGLPNAVEVYKKLRNAISVRTGNAHLELNT